MKRKALTLLTKYFAVFLWLSLLVKTDSYYSIYLLIGIFSIIAIIKNQNTKSKRTWLSYLFASFFSLATTLANYSIFSQAAQPSGAHTIASILALILIFIGGIVVFQNIIMLTERFSIKTVRKIADSPHKIFFISFLFFSIIDLLILFICCYPGCLTPDSIDEVGQILSGTYSNHHPFYYTILIYPFIQIGANLFHDINIGVVLFNIFQILILSAAFSYSISTLYRIGVSKKILYPLIIILAILPYNILFSFTIWKDVLFGAFFLIFTVSLFRCFHSFYSSKKSKIILFTLLTISGLAVCLFRSNALLAIFASTIIFFIIFKKKYFKLGILLTLIVIAAFILKRPILAIINVKQTDTIESLSIPSQQIAKTLKYNMEQISEEDLSIINNIANPTEIAEAYNPTISDPVKNTIRKYNNQSFIKERATDLIALYIKLGVQHPMQYLTAWIDQTRGYWNGGYSFWIWANEVQINDYGIQRNDNSLLSKLFDGYVEIYHHTTFLQPFISIGLIIWILLVLLYQAIVNKNKTNLFLLIPILATWATLLIATPVFSEFRYIYFAFTTAPFLTIITFLKPSKISNQRKQHEKR